MTGDRAAAGGAGGGTSATPPGPLPPGIRILTDARIEEIHAASLEVLRRTGVRVRDAGALALLSGAGCRVKDGDLVFFPAEVVETALGAAPSRVVLCGRDGRERVVLEGGRSFFGTGSDLPNTLDLETGERRPSRLADVRAAARLADALPNLDFVMSMALPSDVPAATADRHSFLAMSGNTTKPIVFTAWDENGLGDILAMAEAIAGGRDALARRPFVLAYLEPTSPLQHSESALRKLLLMADRGLPMVYAPGPVEGATAPVTSAGSLAMANAEILSGLTIAQLRRPGAPCVYGSGAGPLDMRTMVATYTTPEFMLHCLAIAEMGHRRYRLPVWGFAGCSDSKIPDLQAGIESALWVLWMALGGANLVHDVGYVESGLTCSLEMMTATDEIIGFVRRLLQGITITPETLALDTIHEVGHRAGYLTAPHTLKHYRGVWYPRVLDRRPFHTWNAAGRPTAADQARGVARDLLARHTPAPLPADIHEHLLEIVTGADARAGVAGAPP